MGAVTYGLKNVHYAVWDPDTSTYGAWKAIPGAVSLSSDANTNQNDFYADDGVYATLGGANSESGSIEFAQLTDDIMIDLIGYDHDATSGLTYVTTEPKNITVALGYEISGNENKQRGVRYNVTFTAPSQSSNTMTDTTDPDTVTMNYTAIGRDFVINGQTLNVLKAHVDNSSDEYATFFTAVLTPGQASVAEDATLSALTIGSLTLSPTFSSAVTSYSTTTANASDTVTATATDSSDATVVIYNGDTSVASGNSATWSGGTNVLTIVVVNGASSKTYTVLVTKTS